MLQGKHSAAEEVLVSNRLIWAAVDLNVRLFNWDRALGIAEQSDDPMHVQGVLWLRYDDAYCPEPVLQWPSGNVCPCCCLLYTSPSPRDLSTSRMPSSA